MSQKKFESFEERWNNLLEQFPEKESLLLRLRRAISWWRRAEKEMEKEPEDLDARFIFLWIGFNAAYAKDPDAVNGKKNFDTRKEFEGYFALLDSCDKEGRIHEAVSERFFQEIDLLLKNEFVFAPFWKHHNRIPGYENWKKRLQKSWDVVSSAQSKHNTPKILSVVFDRLYVLRIQLIHGGATWDSQFNRDQVRDGSKIMSWMLPIFIDLMLDNHNKDWGPPYYPRVAGKPLLPFPL